MTVLDVPDSPDSEIMGDVAGAVAPPPGIMQTVVPIVVHMYAPPEVGCSSRCRVKRERERVREKATEREGVREREIEGERGKAGERGSERQRGSEQVRERESVRERSRKGGSERDWERERDKVGCFAAAIELLHLLLRSPHPNLKPRNVKP